MNRIEVEYFESTDTKTIKNDLNLFFSRNKNIGLVSINNYMDGATHIAVVTYSVYEDEA